LTSGNIIIGGMSNGKNSNVAFFSIQLQVFQQLQTSGKGKGPKPCCHLGTLQHLTIKECRNNFVDSAPHFHVHGLVSFRWNAIETRTFAVFEFVDRCVDFFICNGRINVSESRAL
jgi:hypothetical protein